MTRGGQMVIGLVVFGLGYLAGTADISLPAQAQAQPPVAGLPGMDVSKEVAERIQDLRVAMRQAVNTLEGEGKYESITADVNPFLLLSGGGNAREDLESGRGVDPETFAALYAGYALPEIGDHLGYDEQGRLTYQNKVVRMYSVSRLRQMYEQRMKFAEEGL